MHPVVALVALATIAIGVPGPVHAATAISIELDVSPTTVYPDEPVTLTATVTPPVAGLAINFVDANSPDWSLTAWTEASGVASVTFVPLAENGERLYEGSHPIRATFAGDTTYEAASSAPVQLTIMLRPVSLSVTYPSHEGGVLHTIDSLVLQARLAAERCLGVVSISHWEDGHWRALKSAWIVPMPSSPPEDCSADISFTTGFAAGLHSFYVQYDGGHDSGGAVNESDEVFVDVDLTLIQTTTVLTATPSPAERDSVTHLTATATDPWHPGAYNGRGTFTFYDGDTVLGTATPLADNATGSIDVEFPATGIHALRATWSGFTNALPSTSPTVNLTVGPNLAHAHDLGLSLATFYPVVDQYKDTLEIHGYVDEPASVTITISNASTGSTVRTLSVSFRETGPYSATWNGRNGSGSLVSAGTYRVRQVVKDAHNATLTVDHSVVVSRKKLYWYKASTTKYADLYTARGSRGAKIVASPRYYRGMRLKFALGTPGRWAALGYQFKLPSATVYGSIKFSILGRGTRSPMIGLHDYSLGWWAKGDDWIIDYFSPLKAVPKDYRWTGLYGNVTLNRKGRQVQALVLAANWPSGSYDIAKVKLTYRYGILQ
jgi:hypothetical protein